MAHLSNVGNISTVGDPVEFHWMEANTWPAMARTVKMVDVGPRKPPPLRISSKISVSDTSVPIET